MIMSNGITLVFLIDEKDIFCQFDMMMREVSYLKRMNGDKIE